MSLSELDAYIERNDLFFQVERPLMLFKSIELIGMTIGRAVPHIKIALFDEFGDAREDNQALCLALLNLEIGEFEDASSPQDWAKAQSNDSLDPRVDTLYIQNEQAIADFLGRYGPIPDVVDEWDWQLNSGLAQALRQRSG